jgi:hypothetical protein
MDRAVIDAYGRLRTLRDAALHPGTLARARALADERHRLPSPQP